jgi:hypothetical protein
MAFKRHSLVETSGLSDKMLASIGAVALLASHTEMMVEKTIWELEGLQRTKSGAVWTDTQPISAQIDRLEKLGPSARPGLPELIKQWCAAARLGFNCRNSIFHGRTFAGFGSGEWAVFARNMPIQGAPRQRKTSEFHASQHTLDLLEDSFGKLFDVIRLIGVSASAPNLALGDPGPILREIKSAWLTLAEIDDLAAAQNHEKN